jgi:hypothetical protein
MLSLTFGKKGEYSEAMRNELATHRWPVSKAKAHPMPLMARSDGSVRIPAARALKLLIAMAEALLAFFERHRAAFEAFVDAPIHETIPVSDGTEITFSFPVIEEESLAEALFGEPLPDESDVLRQMQRNIQRSAGRNDPCPCGSGKKFKKCHLDRPIDPPPRDVHQIDFFLTHRIGHYALERLGDGWMTEFEHLAPGHLSELFVPWIVWSAEWAGSTIAEWYATQHAATFSAEERDFYEGQRNAWLTIWEVVGVQESEVELRDVLTGESRTIVDSKAAPSLNPGDAILARVTGYRRRSYFTAVHPLKLHAAQLPDVLAAVRAQLPSTTPSELRKAKTGAVLIAAWVDVLEQEDEPPPFIPTITEVFSFNPKNQEKLVERLAAMDGVDEIDDDGEEVEITIRSDGEVTGLVVIGDRSLGIQTESPDEAIALGERVRDACGKLLGPRMKR